MNSVFIEVKESLRLCGEVYVEGAKNALLPIVPATLLTHGISTIYNVSKFDDMQAMVNLLKAYNVHCDINEESKSLTIDTTNIQNTIVDASLYSSYRASTLFAGPLLARFKEVWIGMPGGDQIGKRPIDFHLNAFKAFGALVEYKENYIRVYSHALKPATIILDYPSVGATQNILLLASLIEGTTTIKNAAQEPEITDMIIALQTMGVTIQMCFGGMIIIKGNPNITVLNYAVIEDRLEAATLLMMGAITGGSVSIPNAPNHAMDNVFKKLSDMGHIIEKHAAHKGVTIRATSKPFPTKIKTMPYPGFSTDLQSPIMALLAVTPGVSHVHETVFESRMKHAYELNTMGAQIKVEYDCAHITGVNKLVGTTVHANDIRAGAALVLAGLVAQGTTQIFGAHHLLRGYYALDKKIQSLGGYMEIVHAPSPVIFNGEKPVKLFV